MILNNLLFIHPSSFRLHPLVAAVGRAAKERVKWWLEYVNPAPTSFLVVIRKFSGVLLSFFVLCSCAQNESKARITPQVQLNKKSAEMSTPVEVTYRFTTSLDFTGLTLNQSILVHFLDSQGTLRFVDDHPLPVPMNQWVAGRNYTYTRTVVIPESIPAGEYTIELGLYMSAGKGERVELNARKRTSRTYDMGKLLIRPSSNQDSYAEGWYELEREPGEEWYHWRWTKKEAVVRVNNPLTDALLYFKADTNPKRFSEPQHVTIQVRNVILDQFPMNTDQPVFKKYLVSKDQLGSADTVDLRVKVDKTFIPSEDYVSTDSRELGIRVYLFYLGKKTD